MLASWAMFAAASAAADPAPTTAADLSDVPVNSWVQASRETDGNKYLSSHCYSPATDEFIMWGRIGVDRSVSAKYDVETFDLASRKWRSSLPRGKEEAWAGGKFPNWTLYGYSPTGQESCPMVKEARDHCVSGYSMENRVDFVQADGVTRPTRCPVFNQATYDSKRDRLLFFVGGKTFSYDVRQRVWKDLAPATIPLGCETLVWASLCYDPVNDQAVLFGGGQALNTWGGARTWVYDCAANEWRRPDLKIEPPLRCNSRMVYDAKNKLIVLFGGTNQNKGLADTWVYDVAAGRWSERKPQVAPPPARQVAAAFIAKSGLVLVVGPPAGADAKAGRSTWTYDAATNVWTPIKGVIAGPGWLGADYSPKADAVVLTVTSEIAWDAPRTTYIYRLAPAMATEPRPAAAPAVPVSPKADTQPADRKAVEEKLKNLPANVWVDANPANPATVRTWSDCTIDTDKGVIVYYGGGHAAYSGTDVAQYDVGENRWLASYPAEFPPYLESTNRTVFGWSYNLHPWSEHTRRWYAYDPVSKMVVYARQGGNMIGRTAWLGKDGRKQVKIEACDTWIYDPAKRAFYEPTFDRPWGTDDGACLVTTAKGVYALSAGKLWLCKVERHGSGDDETCVGKWTLVAENGPVTGDETSPTIYDSMRNRLISLIGGGKSAGLWFFNLDGKSGWVKADCKGEWAASRVAVFNAEQDVGLLVTYQADKKPSTHLVYRCASNEWVRPDIALPGVPGHQPASYDTSLAWDPVHKVVVMIDEVNFGGATATFLLRYDDKKAKLKQ
jgi:hypothetical protein